MRDWRTFSEEESREFVVLADAAGGIRMVDGRAAKRLGLAAGMRLETLSPPGSGAALRALLARACRECVRDWELPLRVDGREVTYSFRGCPDGTGGAMLLGSSIPEDYGQALREVQGAMEEIVALNRELSLKRHELQERSELVAVASHEIRSPLSSLGYLVERVLAELKRTGLSRLAERIEEAKRQLGRLTDLVDQLLDVSRLESGRLEIRRQDCDLARLVREVVGRFRLEAERAGCELLLCTGAALVGQFDPARLEQVLANLLSNALKYGAGKPVRISLVERGDSVQLSVQDEGVGLARADQDRVFRRFERASAQRFGGVGLGLFVVSELVKAHRGSISVESEPGKGATFTVTLARRADSAGAGA